MRMNINDLRALIALADAGSVSRAASMLRLTQPALTRRIQNLESHLGVALLDRATKPPTLTTTGHRVLDGGRRVLRSLTELEASCRTAGDVVGPLRLGVAYGLAEDVLAAPLTELQRAFPKLELLVKTGWTKQLLEELGHSALDGVIGFLPTTRPGAFANARTLGQEAVAVLAPRRWSTEGKTASISLHDVAWVLNPRACSYRSALETLLDRQGVPVRVAMEVVGRELQLSLIARGAGLGLCPLRGLRASPQSRDVRILRLDDVNIRVDVAMICGPATSDLSPVFETLSVAVEQSLQSVSNSSPSEAASQGEADLNA